MSAQLEHLRQPVVAPQPRRSRAPQLPPVRAPRPTDSRAAPSDPDRGIGLLLSFTGALSVMVADVLVIGAVEQSWILIPGFAVLLLATAIVFRRIMRLLADGGGEATRDAR
jgi:hypothetical protein